MKNNIYVVKSEKTKEFLELFNKPMISEEFFEKCKQSAKGLYKKSTEN